MRNLFLIAVMSIGLYSCSNEEAITTTALSNQANAYRTDGMCETILDLKAGQNYTAGAVTVSNDNLNVYVMYQTNSEWELKEIHLYVGTYNGMPLNKNGSPKIGLFPVSETDVFQKSFTATIPIDPLWGECFVVAAHAVVAKTDGMITQTETAWSEGTRFTSNNWATYSNVCLKDCQPEECYWTNETAFGGAYFGEGNAWWYYYTNDGTQQPIYAGKRLVDGAFVHYINGKITINLGNNLTLANDNEAIKIQGYNIGFLPTSRPAAGHFTYKGNSLEVTIPNYDYYVIHLDVKVKKCN